MLTNTGHEPCSDDKKLWTLWLAYNSTNASQIPFNYDKNNPKAL